MPTTVVGGSIAHNTIVRCRQAFGMRRLQFAGPTYPLGRSAKAYAQKISWEHYANCMQLPHTVLVNAFLHEPPLLYSYLLYLCAVVGVVEGPDERCH